MEDRVAEISDPAVALSRTMLEPVVSGAHADVYVDTNINDGKTDTYWESNGLPAEVVFDL